jgi:hypothetical protein
MTTSEAWSLAQNTAQTPDLAPVHDVLQTVSLCIQPQMRRSGVIAPFDAGFIVEQNHAIGRSLNGLQKILQLFLVHAASLCCWRSKRCTRSAISRQTPCQGGSGRKTGVLSHCSSRSSFHCSMTP